MTINHGVFMHPFIDIHEASKMSGKSKSTVKRWAKNQLIVSKKNNSGHWTFDPQSIKEYLAQHGTIATHEATKNQPHPTDWVSMNHLRSVHDSLDRERKINDELREQNRKLQGEITQLTHEIKSILSKESKSLISRWLRT